MKALLIELEEQDQIVNSKAYGKQVVFYPDQSKFDVADEEELNRLRASFESLKDQLDAKKREVGAAAAEKARLASQMTDAQLSDALESLAARVASQESSLMAIKGQNKEAVDPQAYSKLMASQEKYVKVWKKRKRLAMDFVADICEGMGEKPQTLVETMGLETDAEVGVDIKDFLRAKKRSASLGPHMR
jgi:26S proteasome regulatory subunit (ATPase 3-interacting protein)